MWAARNGKKHVGRSAWEATFDPAFAKDWPEATLVQVELIPSRPDKPWV